jgi:2-succinyl-6-hydroxy-2,4-cyclohexadiene-1-carboxylate synthase
MLLHGFTGSGASWQTQRRLFAPSAFCPDLPGHGANLPADDVRTAFTPPTPPAAYRIEATADALAVQLAALPQPRTLLGYSLGGRVALTLAVRHPQLLDCLILESASPGIADDGERTERRARDEALAEDIERRGMAWFVEMWEAQPLFASHARLPADVRAAQRAARLANDPHGLAASLRGMGAGVMPPLWEALAHLAVPTLLISGADDAKYTAIARQMAALMPQAQHVIIAGSGHTPHLEQAAAFAAAAGNFHFPHPIASPLQPHP